MNEPCNITFTPEEFALIEHILRALREGHTVVLMPCQHAVLERFEASLRAQREGESDA